MYNMQMVEYYSPNYIAFADPFEAETLTIFHGAHIFKDNRLLRDFTDHPLIKPLHG
jgi:hypothetical protein